KDGFAPKRRLPAMAIMPKPKPIAIDMRPRPVSVKRDRMTSSTRITRIAQIISGIQSKSDRLCEANAENTVVTDKIIIQPVNKPIGMSTKNRSLTVRSVYRFKLPTARTNNTDAAMDAITSRPQSWKCAKSFAPTAKSIALETYQAVVLLRTAEYCDGAH